MSLHDQERRFWRTMIWDPSLGLAVNVAEWLLVALLVVVLLLLSRAL